MKYISIDQAPTLADRLQYAMDQLAFTQESLAQAAGCSQTTIFKITSGKTKESKKIGAIARALGISAVWLESGEMPQILYPDWQKKSHVVMEKIAAWGPETPLDDDEIELPFYKKIEMSAGNGATSMQQHSTRKLRFSLLDLRDNGVNPSNALCATVSGRSQEPLILSGSAIGIDQGMTRIVPDQLYALEQEGELRVKFLERLPDGGLKVISYNRDEYPDETISFDQFIEKQMRILGRVFWWSTLRSLNSPPLPRNCLNEPIPKK